MKKESGFALWWMVLGFVCVGMLASCESSQTTMDGPEIKALFAGKTVEGRHEKHGYTFVSYYEPDGEFRSYQNGAKEPKIGKWWVKGNLICVRWKEENKDLCRNMVKRADGKYRKVLVKGNGKRIPIVSFQSFAEGNAKKL